MEDEKPYSNGRFEQLIFIEGLLHAGPSIPHESAHLILMGHWGKDYYYTCHMQPTGLGCVGEKVMSRCWVDKHEKR